MAAFIDTIGIAGWLLILGVFGIAVSRIFYFVGAATILLALRSGEYWALFPRGTGFFTANRVSAAAFYFFSLAAPTAYYWILSRVRRRANRPKAAQPIADQVSPPRPRI